MNQPANDDDPRIAWVRRAIYWLAVATAVLAIAMWHLTADAKQARSQSARSAFVRAHPCPATGKPSLPCKGYIIDHVTPLCAGGPDSPSNMQWQTVADAKAKDREEVKQCKAVKSK